MPRIFIALPVATEVRQALAVIPRNFPSRDAPSLRWVAAHQLHITLRFLGDVGEPEVEAVRAAAEAAVEAVRAAAQAAVEAVPAAADEAAGQRDRRPLRLTAKGIGAFPDIRRARVIWAGVTGDVNQLRQLQAAVEKQLAAKGLGRDRRPFTPHITIARSRSHAPLPAALQAYREHEFGSWSVDHIQIMESRLSSSGPRYIVRHQIPLDARHHGTTASPSRVP